MKKQIAKDELGIAHLGLIVLAVALLAVVGFGVTRVVSQNSGSSQVSQSDDDMEKDLSDDSDGDLDGTDDVEDGNE